MKMKKMMIIPFLMLLLIVFCLLACPNGTVPGGAISVTLTLDPENLGYFEYRGIQYSETGPVQVIAGDYLYYHENGTNTGIVIRTGSSWTPTDDFGARSPQKVSGNMTVARSDIVASVGSIITLVLNPGEGSYFEYRGIEYHDACNIQVTAGDYLYYYETDKAIISCANPSWEPVADFGARTKQKVSGDMEISSTDIGAVVADVVTLTLDPGEWGYFEYNGTKYSDAGSFRVKAGYYLYYRINANSFSKKIVVHAEAPWTSIDKFNTRSQQTITGNVNVSHSAIGDIVDNIVTLDLDPTGLFKKNDYWIGQGYYKYREIEYYGPIKLDVIAGEKLFYYLGVGTAATMVTGYSLYGNGGYREEPIKNDGTFHDGASIVITAISGVRETDQTITLTLDPEGNGHFYYMGNGLKIYNESIIKPAGLYLYYYETSGKKITEVYDGWDLVSDTAARSKQVMKSDKSVSRSNIVAQISD